MKIKEVETFLDGGTIKIITDKGIICVDNRLFTTTKGKLFHGYPRHDNKNIITQDLNSLKNDLLECLETYEEKKTYDIKKDYIIQLIKENN